MYPSSMGIPKGADVVGQLEHNWHSGWDYEAIRNAASIHRVWTAEIISIGVVLSFLNGGKKRLRGLSEMTDTTFSSFWNSCNFMSGVDLAAELEKLREDCEASTTGEPIWTEGVQKTELQLNIELIEKNWLRERVGMILV